MEITILFMISLYSFQLAQSFKRVSLKGLAPIWQTILLSDGSLTRHLEILSGGLIQLKIELVMIIQSYNSFDKLLCSKILYPQLSRKIWLTTKEGSRIVYANSIWDADELSKLINNEKLPLGISFIESELDIFKQIYKIDYIYSIDLENSFKQIGPFWSRYYFLLHHGKIIASILEIFSPCLENMNNIYY